MDLHTKPDGVHTQMDTLSLHARKLFDALHDAIDLPGTPRIQLESLFFHLRNSVNLLDRAAQGYAWTVEEMLPLIAFMADHGEISQSAAKQILAPAYEHLGDEYTVAAMATEQKG